MNSKIKIYHNPRCQKSRTALQYLEDNNLEHEIIFYLKTPPSPDALKKLLKALNIKAEELLRKKESLWKTEFAQKEFTEEELIEVMSKHPKLIERPIVEKEGKAVIARLSDKLINFLHSN